MKFLIRTLLTLAAIGAAAPSRNVDLEAFDHVTSIIRRDGIQNCNECQDHLDLCTTFGVAPGIDKCKDVCMDHLCRKYPSCRNCDEKFNKCS